MLLKMLKSCLLPIMFLFGCCIRDYSLWGDFCVTSSEWSSFGRFDHAKTHIYTVESWRAQGQVVV